MTLGLIPAAGSASRIHGIPKYLLPLPNEEDGYLIKRHIRAMFGAKAHVVTIAANPENEALLRQYTHSRGMLDNYDQGVTVVDKYATMSETLLSIYRLFKGWGTTITTNNVLFGMADTYIEDDQCYQKLDSALEDGADVAVALFRSRPLQYAKVGMCDVNPATQQIIEVVDKPPQTQLRWLWGALAWKPAFWNLLQPEYPHVGYALPQAIKRGLDVRAVKCDGQYFDCGSYSGYEELVLHLHGRKEASEMTAKV